ncbi:MAG TPA: hypothetical protein VLB46_04915 [Pyrinomonadaceae bacterium]|nr:hypothetical protein [Pyrinomonadaceae bacterium]
MNRPDVDVLPGSDGKKSTAQTQTTETPESPQAPCTFTVLIAGEVMETWLELSGVPCILCTVPSDLSHSNASILGLSLSPNGPWTEELTVMTTLNAQGNGTSEHFFIKGEAEGISILHIQGFLASNDYEFRVVPCACPEIPIVP